MAQKDLQYFSRLLTGLECARALGTTHMAVADVVLQDAKQLLGPAVVQSRLFDLRSSASQLSAAQVRVSEPRTSLMLIRGEAVETSPRTGQLKLVSSWPRLVAPAWA